MDSQFRNQTRRPRWGTYSTRGHLDEASLATDLLLYDKLIFPTPRPDALDDWVRHGWQPDKQQGLLKKLGDELAYTATWEGELQDRFRKQHSEVKRELVAHTSGQDAHNVEAIAAEIAYPATALLLAAQANEDPMFVANEKIPPIAIAAFQTQADAEAIFALRRVHRSVFEADVRSEVDKEFSVLFTRKLAFPDLDKVASQEALDRVIELAKSTDYQAARRALYDWEQEVVRERWPVETAMNLLEELADEHDELVDRHFCNLWIRRVVCVASIVLPPTVSLAAGPAGFLGGLAATGLLTFATSKVPRIKAPYAEPGAALGMAIDAVWKV
ncbi:MAG: hypothetical protein MPJ50_11975 [Pirellulales bacterium]|nr:hypothetical protein [Pirellulales bacterium]